ncbi:hypothetical protein ZOSMA_160G00030 [Zostera marina]|uniref:Uncharacterized protein n=1 Tax=Zostera marina TaxID=29655 RepID=A0A0K9PUM6_ZOSMR|nr:hypothetical protein ZOSMA_160G00030 [Zostera marina]
MNDISQFMESLSSDFFAVLRADGLLRSTTSKLGAPQQLRLLAYAKHAVYGLDKESSLENQGYKIRYVISRSRANISYLQLIIFLKMLDLLSRFEQLRRKLFKTINLMFLLLFGEDKTSNYLI